MLKVFLVFFGLLVRSCLGFFNVLRVCCVEVFLGCLGLFVIQELFTGLTRASLSGLIFWVALGLL